MNSLLTKKNVKHLLLLKRYYWENWRSQNFDFVSLKNCHQVSFCGAPTHADIIEFQNFL